MTRPLDAVKVLELAEYGFVPSAAAVLADWGADVIKVEHPRGDPLRGIMAAGLLADTGDFNFIVEHLNRNKRGIGLDLNHDGSRQVFDRLVSWADVFITNFLPGARTRLRIQPEDLHKLNPRLVYGRGHGQGQAGPDADQAGFDSISYWGRAGIGHMLTPLDGPLVMQRAAMGDVTGGMFLAGGVAAALFARERSGRGIVVDVSLLATGVWVLAPDLVAASVVGADPPRPDVGSVRPNPLVGAYRTADGRWLLLNMMDSDRYWAAFCRAMGWEGLVERADFADAKARAAHAAELQRLVTEAIASKPLEHWRSRLGAEECVWSFMASPAEVLADVQVEANGYMPAHPEHGRARLASSPVQFDGEPVSVRRVAPGLGSDTDEVMAELGIPPDDVERLRASGAAV